MGASVSFDSAALFNLLGMPAGVVAVPDGAGLPVGVQIAGPKWREDVVLRAMAAVEMAVIGAAHDRGPVTPGPKSSVPVTEPA